MDSGACGERPVGLNPQRPTFTDALHGRRLRRPVGWDVADQVNRSGERAHAAPCAGCKPGLVGKRLVLPPPAWGCSWPCWEPPLSPIQADLLAAWNTQLVLTQLHRGVARGCHRSAVLVARSPGWYLGTKPQPLIRSSSTGPEKGNRALVGCPVGSVRLNARPMWSRSVAHRLATLLSGLKRYQHNHHSDL